MATTQQLHDSYGIRPNPQDLVQNQALSWNNKVENKSERPTVDYEPNPDRSIKLSPEHENIVECITRLYSGSASEEDMEVYTEEAIYDDPWSYCDTRHKIASQCPPSVGISKFFSSRTLKTEIMTDSPQHIIYKQQQEYTPKLLHFSHAVNSLVTLTLDDQGKVRYHKDIWNENDYNHEGLKEIMMTLNGDHLMNIAQPPQSL
ncbi:MAG: hypothetical protein M1834_004379 [Cirrosporium novae-zelandiae]|nr:MAG: hypothetical protein M1834_004379 [Cirrosporium novae-zelandiae]